jgi:Cupin superfamily protein
LRFDAFIAPKAPKAMSVRDKNDMLRTFVLRMDKVELRKPEPETPVLEEATLTQKAAAIINAIPSTLDDLICPLSREEFFSQYWGKSFVHAPGSPGKFGRLFPWSELNQVLECHRISPMRLRLFKDGEPIAPKSYMSASETGGARVRIFDLTHNLSEGATLVLDDADELYRPLGSLAAALERIFRARIQVNLYAGWGTSRGFNLHWDDHNVFILQVSGSKRWVLHEPTRLHPLKPDAENAPVPEGPPVWDSMLRDGDLLYIPRGWWHVAYPQDEPCLHLTVGINSHTGLDLLHWFVNTLRASVDVRKDLPHLGAAEDQAKYIECLGKELLASWNTNVLAHFMAEADAQAQPRLRAHLPYVAARNGIPLRENTRIKLVAPRRLNLTDDRSKGVVRFKCFGKPWQFDRKWLPILELLNEDGQSHALEELNAATLNNTDSATVQDFVREMIRSGLFVVESDA